LGRVSHIGRPDPGEEARSMARNERTEDVSQPGRREEVVLSVRLTPGERFTGLVGRSAPDLSHPFSGWIDFMSAVNALRDQQTSTKEVVE
jgi:hypothetical protein